MWSGFAIAFMVMAVFGHSNNHRTLHPRRRLQPRGDSQRYVFAHFIVGIVSNRVSSADWDADMQRAKSYGIDAFALNIGTDTFTDTQLEYAYQSADDNGMKVFLSFDFNYWSTSSGTAIGQKIARYADNPAQLMVDSKPFVSSFLGDGVDVAAIRDAAGLSIYFAPNFQPGSNSDFSSIDAAFNWAAWPNNGRNRAPDADNNITVSEGDQSYISALSGKDYIAPVSPWFFTHFGNEVSYSKNWLFPSDTLWFDRWNDLLTLSPRFVEIVTWNDYGESHYVGPLSSPHTDDGSSNWAHNMTHNGWLDMAKPYIAAYKAGARSVHDYITTDQLIYWYRLHPKSAVYNTTDKYQTGKEVGNPSIGPPEGWQTVSDSIFVVALLKDLGQVQITSCNNSQTTFQADTGANLFSVPMGIGTQKFALIRNGSTILSGYSSMAITGDNDSGIYNFNAYVGSLPAGPSDILAPAGMTAFTLD